MRSLKDSIKAVLRAAGFEFRRYNVHTSADAQLIRALSHLEIDLVLDIGANSGQYGFALREHGYRGRIVSFEPSSAAYVELVHRASGDRNWTVAPRTALGASAGRAVLNIAGNSVSNSIRGMLPSHRAAAPDSAYVGTEEVPLQTLDALAPQYLVGAYRVLLKIDTQGFEDAVLAGAEKSLGKVAAVQVELSLIPLYEEQLLFDQMRERLKDLGFNLHALFAVYSDERTGQTLQLDGLFVRQGISVS